MQVSSHELQSIINCHETDLICMQAYSITLIRAYISTCMHIR